MIMVMAAVFVTRLLMLFQTSYPNGLDGFFYALEARSFMERCHLENPNAGPVYYLAGLLAILIGDPIASVKIMSAALSSLYVSVIFLFLRKWVDKAFALTGALFAAISPSLVLMSVNYLNNMLGVVSFIAFCAIGTQMFRHVQKLRPGNLFLLMVTALLSIISHPTTAVFLCAVVFLFLFQIIIRRKSGKVIVISLAFMMVILFFASLFLGIADLERFKGVFSLKPALALLSGFFIDKLSLAVALEMTIYMLSAYVFVFYYCRANRGFTVYLLMIPLFYFPFWNLDQLDMGYRLLLAATPFGIIFLILFLSMISGNTMASEKKDGTRRNSSALNKNLRFAYLLLPFIWVSTFSYNSDRDPPYAYYRVLVEKIDLPEDSLLIAHQGLNHVYTYYNHFKDSLNYVPDFEIPVEKLWRICYGLSPRLIITQFPEAAEKGLVWELGDEYTLIREDYWQQFLDFSEPELRESYNNWYNPFTARPKFIRAEKK